MLILHQQGETKYSVKSGVCKAFFHKLSISNQWPKTEMHYESRVEAHGVYFILIALKIQCHTVAATVHKG